MGNFFTGVTPLDGRTDKGRYRHDSRADKNPYPHDRRADSLSHMDRDT